MKSLFEVQKGNYPNETWMRCWRGEWEERSFHKDDEFKIGKCLKKRRGRSCPFYKYRAGLEFEQAEKLQEHDLASKRFTLMIRIMLLAAVVAIMGVIVTMRYNDSSNLRPDSDTQQAKPASRPAALSGP